MPDTVTIPVWFLVPCLAFMLAQFGVFLAWARGMDQKVTTLLTQREHDAKEIEKLRERYHELAPTVRHLSSKLNP